MKETIHRVLERYVGRESNLDSLALREMIVDEIVDELKSKGAMDSKSDYVDDDLNL